MSQDAGPTFQELEQCVKDVIVHLNHLSVPNVGDIKILIVGGLALWKYLRNFRATMDADFWINLPNAPKSVKDKLVAIPNSPFVRQVDVFQYVHPTSGKRIQIDFVPDWMAPHLEAEASKLGSLSTGQIPWLNEIDLLVCKIQSCGLRPKIEKRVQDAGDAVALTLDLTRNGPISLSTGQASIVQEGLDDVVSHSGRDKQWWQEKLGLRRSPTPERSSPPRNNPGPRGGSDRGAGDGRGSSNPHRGRSRDGAGRRGGDAGPRGGSPAPPPPPPPASNQASHGTTKASLLQPIKNHSNTPTSSYRSPLLTQANPSRSMENSRPSGVPRQTDTGRNKVSVPPRREQDTHDVSRGSRKPNGGLSSGLRNLALR